jgi:hypothetical protein
MTEKETRAFNMQFTPGNLTNFSLPYGLKNQLKALMTDTDTIENINEQLRMWDDDGKEYSDNVVQPPLTKPRELNSDSVDCNVLVPITLTLHP